MPRRSRAGYMTDTASHSLDRVSRTPADWSNNVLAGRIRLAGVFRPGDPGAVAETMVQAFVWTDVVATGLLTLGQHIELQWQLA